MLSTHTTKSNLTLGTFSDMFPEQKSLTAWSLLSFKLRQSCWDFFSRRFSRQKKFVLSFPIFFFTDREFHLWSGALSPPSFSFMSRDSSMNKVGEPPLTFLPNLLPAPGFEPRTFQLHVFLLTEICISPINCFASIGCQYSGGLQSHN